jgi:aspartokinase-like uncharacterized kinase
MTVGVVVKVGGSLFDLPDLGPRLARWLGARPTRDALLVPGGGPAADAVRDLDRWQRLGEERAHVLALRALTLNAHFLAGLLPAAEVVDGPDGGAAAVRRGRVPVLDAFAFVRDDERRHPADGLPHSWSATSDAVAARAAVAAGARQLLLLKSVTVAAEQGWDAVARRGQVDEVFCGVVREAGPALEVRAVNFRLWRP